jgi:hypothetical protein
MRIVPGGLLVFANARCAGKPASGQRDRDLRTTRPRHELMKRLIEASRQYQLALEHQRRGATENASTDELEECEQATEALREHVIDLIVEAWSGANL